MDLKFLPRPRQIDILDGFFAISQTGEIRLSSSANMLMEIFSREWQKETGEKLSVKQVNSEDFFFTMGEPTTSWPPVAKHPEAYSLEIRAHSLIAHADSYQGLVYAWQTLKQILRHNAQRLPCLRIRDWPDLRWRVYHLDLKATRRRLSNLYDILPQLSEFKINAVLVEYEDYIRLERHPGLAVPDALSKEDVRNWVNAARAYGIAVIPLVQTLAHWQYILGRPEYAHLQEMPGDTTSACPSQSETWTLASDFLEEMMDIHPDAPFIHVGLDEVFQLGKCRACRDKMKGRTPDYLFTDWANRICSYVLDRGKTPMMWGDMIKPLVPEMGQRLNRDTVYVDWGYMHSGPTHPYVNFNGKNYISREWLCRPEGEISNLPRLNFIPSGQIFEDLSEDERRMLRPYLDNPEFPKKMRADIRLAWLEHLNLKRGVVTGIRVSYHGCIAPLFIHGQLNTLTGAQACRQHDASILIGSSWSRGHSFARTNAHPELDWYGIATLGDSGWSTLNSSGLRDFDVRFGFQFFGLKDGHIGDLYYLFERSSPRAHDVMDNYLEYIKQECRNMSPQIKRNHARFSLFAAVNDLQILRFRAQIALLETEYFYANREGVPVQFKERVLKDIIDTEAEMNRRDVQLQEIYRETLIDADAKELASAQLQFWKDNMLAMKNLFFGTGNKTLDG